MKNNRKEILQKLLHSRLTQTEEKELLTEKHLQKEMETQWESGAHFSLHDLKAKERIWKNIRRDIWKEETPRRISLSRVAVYAACFLLLIGFTITFFPGSKNKTQLLSVTWHTVESEIKELDSLMLPDGTQVQIGPNTRLEYPEQFTGTTRTVRLLGQAYFDVIPDKNRPFVVESPGMNITALGTAFEVYNYGSGWLTETILSEGKVRVDIPSGKSGKIISEILYPDQKIIFDRENNRITKEVVNADRYSSWSREHILSYENENLALVLPRLEQWYGCKIIYDKATIQNYRFTFKVREESIDRILFMFQSTSSLAYTQNEEGEYELYEIP